MLKDLIIEREVRVAPHVIRRASAQRRYGAVP